ncbi:hypothetical protein [Paraburkholderia sp. BL17N1]|uniref:hypothetical protein n=1 Tax=Paraburkholderia sp. BL17N1 TaxID=1938798 RepID=UPI000EAC6CCF|nr:hypothetical protein [Paraburkholderia sp. BL17N1]RKR38564.1 hypothetical protein B0G82_6708 [Paraburkholderia sp. BL17N1]
MADRFVTPFDLYRASLSFALQMLSFSHEARQRACEFEMQRARRDMAAAHAVRNAAAAAGDWSEFAASYQASVRDYLATTVNLWQQGLGSAVQGQRGFSEGLCEALATWQSAWREQWPTHVPMNPVMLPWQAWQQQTQSAVAGMPYGRAGRTGASQVTPFDLASRGVSPVASGGEKQGEPHVG